MTNSNGARSAAQFADEAAADTTGKSGASYEPEAVALFARMTVQPDATRKGLINTLIKSLKTGGVWAKLDALYVTAAHDAQAARRNWVADLYNLTAVASPTFTVDRGYQGDGSASYLSTGFNPSTAGGKYSQNNAHVSVWSLSDLVSNASIISDDQPTAGASRTAIASRFGSTSSDCRINGTTALSTTVASSLGLFIASRTTAVDLKYWPGSAAAVASGANNSGAIASYPVSLMRDSLSGGRYWAGRIAQASIGSGLSDAEKATLNSALNNYLSAVGAI